MKKQNRLCGIRILTFLQAFFLSFMVFAQETHEIVPPTPTAAALAQFADVPVSLYTGLPNIGVPIYTVKSGPLSVPINLSYHGGGIKVSQEASWVGLGWSLSAGGSISRVIRGNDDLFYEATPSIYIPHKTEFINSVNIPDQNAPQEDWDNYYDYLVYHGHDPEPDIFYYNFGSFSGKFVIEKPADNNQNEIVGNPLDAEAIKIIYYKAEGLWEITDPTGTIYEFSVPETTKTYSFSSGSLSLSSILADKDALRTNDGWNPNPLITTWYLKEITSPVSDHTITFEYDQGQYETQGQIRISQQVVELIDQDIICEGSSPGTNPIAEPRINSGSIDVTQDVYLSRINFVDGHVEFSTSDRIDILSTSSTLNPQRLDGIQVYDVSNPSAVLTANFDYDYFQKSVSAEDIPEYYRLKLEGVEVQDQRYAFAYNDPGILLPSKVSLSLDYWGYFNNADNHNLKRWAENDINTVNRPGTLIPGVDFTYINFSGETKHIYFAGADREPKEDFTKYFMLEEIKLPTGGTHTFEWEPNQYQGNKTLNNAVSDFLDCAYTNTDPNPPTSYGTVYCESEEFEIVDDFVELNLDFIAVANLYGIDPYQYANNIYGYLKWESGTWNATNFDVDLQNIDFGFSSGERTANLTPGTYKIFMQFQPDLFTLDVSWDYYETIYLTDVEIEGAGLRIGKITMDDGRTPMIKSFKYQTEDESESSGLLMANLLHHYPVNAGFQTGATNCATNALFLHGNSNSVFSLSVRGNNHVGYSRVSSSYVGNEVPGETISEYYNFAPYSSVLIQPPNFPMETDPRNGMQKNITIKNDVGTTVEEKSYTYVVSNNYYKNTPGTFIFRSLLSTGVNTGQMFPNGMTFNQYPNYSEWTYLSHESTTRYDKNGNNPVATSTSYEHDNPDHLQLTRATTTNSRGQIELTNYDYPSDYPGGTGMTTATFDQMVQENMLTPVIKQETTVDGNPTSQQINTYKIWDVDDDNVSNDPDDIILPELVKTAKGTDTPENRFQYVSYYENGNIREVLKADGTPIVYIWGYNVEYPLAKIENASFENGQANTISTAQSNAINDAITASNGDINNTTENTLRQELEDLRAAFPKSMVTTYTYDPLIGVTSITDPRGYTLFYGYDGFNRLKEVRDADNNLVEDYEYHYKGRTN